ncbi:MAG TPA: SWIM zinc finger family protein [Candidatus Angelobacter sp.]
MDTREQRGKVIAATGLVRKTKTDSMIWEVPSQSEKGYYRVDLATDEPTCTCLDYELRKMPCKHVYAVAHVVVAHGNPDGSTTITETLTVTKKKTYPQKWREYNAAQTGEQDRFQELLRDLCAGVQEPIVQRRGRPSIPLSDAIFAATFKVYSCFSGRRFMSDLREANKRGKSMVQARFSHNRHPAREIGDFGNI